MACTPTLSTMFMHCTMCKALEDCDKWNTVSIFTRAFYKVEYTRYELVPQHIFAVGV